MSKQSPPIAKALKSAGLIVLSFISGGKKGDHEVHGADDDDVADVADDGEYFSSSKKLSTASVSTPTTAPDHGGSISLCDWAIEKCFFRWLHS